MVKEKILIETRFGTIEYQKNEQIYPWGYLVPGKYQEVYGCCGGCRMSLENNGPLLEGHMGCSGTAFDSEKKEIDCQLIDGNWYSLVEVA
jgi:hypothetical protein